jgi:hypothetical protein
MADALWWVVVPLLVCKTIHQQCFMVLEEFFIWLVVSQWLLAVEQGVLPSRQSVAGAGRSLKKVGQKLVDVAINPLPSITKIV